MTDSVQEVCAGRRSITSVTPTLCALLGIDAPALCTDTPLVEVLKHARERGVERARRCLVYAPDAVGTFLYDRHIESFAPVTRHAPVRASLCSVMPSVTPVCYTSMFTGAPPEAHGLTAPSRPRPILTCDTIVDALLRAGLRVAIAAKEGSSIGRLFLDRHADYLLKPDDESVDAGVLGLIEAGRHDFIIAYNNKADKALHRMGPYSNERIDAMRTCIETFAEFGAAIDRHWSGYDRIIAFTPDHGGHLSAETGRGKHGEDTPEDMHVEHFFGVRPREE